MPDAHSKHFIECLRLGDLAGLRTVPKADLHNHFVLGGSREYIFEKTGIRIESLDRPLPSMDAMHEWAGKNLGERFNGLEMRILLIEAAFHQAKIDGVTVLEIGEDIWANRAYFDGNVASLIDAFHAAHKRIAPDIELRLQIGISRHCSIERLREWLEPFWEREEFYSIDLYGDELAQPIDKFVPIYKKAKERGLRLKAHLGEWGAAEDVVEGVKMLGLDEIQHGIAAAQSPRAMEFLAKNGIRLNICPSSNVMLERVESIPTHPIRRLFRAGVEVTINSDDVLIFDSDVSKEFLRLYQNGTLTAEELDEIRIGGLRTQNP